MQKICLTILLALLINQTGLAQTLKTEVLVYGSGPGAAAAGIQSARSGVKTLWINEDRVFTSDQNLSNPSALQSGIWVEFAKNYLGVKEKNVPITEKMWLKADSANAVLNQMCDTVKRLSTLKASSIQSIKKSASGWDLRLANGKKIKASVLIDASSDHRLLKILNVQAPDTTVVKLPASDHLLAKTSVAALGFSTVLPIRGLIPAKTERVIAVPLIDSVSTAMHAGQAAGATAAYCSFFKTNTQNLNVRVIQSELLTYQSALIPFGDILPSDSNFVKIQHLALSGLIDAGVEKENGLRYWMPEYPLSTEVLKLPMKALYSRSQIWFADHPSAEFSIKSTIDLLMYTATRGEELRREIERNWKSVWAFKNPYQPERPISRLEFAILADTYLQPFSIRIDTQGQLLN